MPTIQIPGIKDPVSFPDDLTHEQLVEAVDTAWKSQFKEDEVDFERGRLGSAAASFGRAVTEGIGQVVSGLGRVESMLTAGSAQPEGEAYTSPEDRQRIQAESPISKAGEAIQQGAKEAYRTNPKYQGEFLAETLPQALGSTAISAAAAGVGGPVAGGAAYGLMSGEQAAKEAEDSGKPEQADIAFMLNAPVGALSESLLGAGPRFWKTVKAVREAGVEPAKAIPSLLKIAAKSSAYEGTQEGVEQLAQNAIAQRLYDPNRPITQGVVESVKAGASVGVLLGGAGGVIGQIDSKVAKAEIATKTAEEGAPATGLAILQTPTPATDGTPSIDVSGIQQEVEKLNLLIEEAKGLQAQGQALTDEQAKQIAVLEKSRPKGEMIEAPVEQPAAPTVETAQPTEQAALPEEQPTTQPSNADTIEGASQVVSSEQTGPSPQVAEGITGGDVQAAGTKVEEKGAGVQPEVKDEVQPEIPSVSQAESKLASIVNDAVAQEDVRKSKGLGISPTASTRSSDVVIGPKDLTSVSQVVEERWNDALRKKETLLDKVTDTLTSAYRSMTRTHAELDPVTFAKEEDIFRRLANSRNMAARQAVDVLKGITKNIGPKQYSVFNRVIVLEDLLKDVESGLYAKGQQLPFGYANEIELRADLDKFRSIADATPQIKQALERRNEFMNSLRDTLVERGILPESVKEDPRYFHHQVLLYMAEKNAGSGSRNFRDWFSGWQKSRVGSSLDYNRQYVEAEASMIADAFNKMALQDYQAEMKAAADISDSLKKLHGKEWRQHIPPGYKLWQPKRGTIFYPAHTVAENVMENYLNGLGDILPEQFKQALVVGGPREQWAIPAELAKVLDTLTPPAERGIAKLADGSVSGWKRYILYMPLRFLKFSINNLSGDVDFVLASAPAATKYWKQSVKDVYSIHAKGTIPTGDVRQAMKDAVIGSGWKQSELPDISADEAFSWITGEKKGLIDKYWDFVGKINDIREDGLRLAVYRYAIDQWKNGKNFYGASKPAEVDKLATPELKAAKVARELMIDYGKTTEFSSFMRKRVFPFWKWAEGNFGRYIQLMKNASIEGSPSVGDVAGLAVRRGVTKTAVAGASTAAKAALLYGMINLWNHLMFPKEEEELGEARNQLHLVLGRHPDGTVSTLRIQGSLSDVLEWFDLADFPNDISQIASGKASIADKANDAWKAAISKLVNGAQPFVKTGYEIATKRSLYPDITHPRPIRDRAEHLARLFSLGNIYKYFAGIPQSPQNKALYSLITYNVDPGEAAYNTTRHMVSEFLKKNGKEPTDYTPTAKSNALYYYKQALRYKDNALADKWLKEYYDLGGKSEGITQSISRSSPTSSLGRLKGQFYDSLSPSEKAIVDRADDWFRKVYQR